MTEKIPASLARATRDHGHIEEKSSDMTRVSNPDQIRKAVIAPVKASARMSRRSIFQRERSRLITLAYTAIKAGKLELTESHVKAFCAASWTAPVLDDYDAGMNGGAGRGTLTGTQADLLLDGVVRHVLERYDPSVFAARQRAISAKRQPKATVEDLTLGLSIPQQAQVLGVTERTVSRLRAVAKVRTRRAQELRDGTLHLVDEPLLDMSVATEPIPAMSGATEPLLDMSVADSAITPAYAMDLLDIANGASFERDPLADFERWASPAKNENQESDWDALVDAFSATLDDALYRLVR